MEWQEGLCLIYVRINVDLINYQISHEKIRLHSFIYFHLGLGVETKMLKKQSREL